MDALPGDGLGLGASVLVGWYAVVQDAMDHRGKLLPRGAIVRYREWYGTVPARPTPA
jgi:hypothetical protein